MTTEESNSQDMERGMLEKHSALQEIQVGHSSIDNAKDQEEVSEKKTVCSKMKDFLVSNFLPITLIIAIVFGALVPQPGVFINHKATSYVCVIGIFLYSGLFLKTDEMISAIKSYRSAGWGCFSILFLTCVIGSELTVLLPFDHRVSERTSNISSNRFVPGLFGHQEFKIGFQVFFIVPCTVSSGVVLVSNSYVHSEITFFPGEPKSGGQVTIIHQILASTFRVFCRLTLSRSDEKCRKRLKDFCCLFPKIVIFYFSFI